MVLFNGVAITFKSFFIKNNLILAYYNNSKIKKINFKKNQFYFSN
jgi:hypothetical protein